MNDKSKLSKKDEDEINESLSEPIKENSSDNALTTLDESYLKDNANVGLEEVTPEDLPTPFLTLIGTNSTLQDAEGRPYPRGAFVYRATGEVLEEVDCTILSLTKSNTPSYSDKSIMEPAYIILGVLNEGTRPFKIILKSTGIGAFKQYLGNVTASKLPMFTLRTIITSEKIQGEKGTYYKYKFTVKEMHKDMDQIMVLENLAKTYGPKMKGEETEEKVQPLAVADDIPFD